MSTVRGFEEARDLWRAAVAGRVGAVLDAWEQLPRDLRSELDLAVLREIIVVLRTATEADYELGDEV